MHSFTNGEMDNLIDIWNEIQSYGNKKIKQLSFCDAFIYIYLCIHICVSPMAWCCRSHSLSHSYCCYFYCNGIHIANNLIIHFRWCKTSDSNRKKEMEWKRIKTNKQTHLINKEISGFAKRVNSIEMLSKWMNVIVHCLHFFFILFFFYFNFSFFVLFLYLYASGYV